jgi:hypothetical protein
MTSEELNDLALGVLTTLDGASAETLRLFSAGLNLADGPAAQFAQPVFYLSCDREDGSAPSFLTVLSMRGALKSAGSLLVRLADGRVPVLRRKIESLCVGRRSRAAGKGPVSRDCATRALAGLDGGGVET